MTLEERMKKRMEYFGIDEKDNSMPKTLEISRVYEICNNTEHVGFVYDETEAAAIVCKLNDSKKHHHWFDPYYYRELQQICDNRFKFTKEEVEEQFNEICDFIKSDTYKYQKTFMLGGKGIRIVQAFGNDYIALLESDSAYSDKYRKRALYKITKSTKHKVVDRIIDDLTHIKEEVLEELYGGN